MASAHAAAPLTPQTFPTPEASTSDARTDAFYAKLPVDQLAAFEPGTILRVREIKPKAYFGFEVDARAWQLMFRSTDGRGRPVASITTVLVPPNAPAKGRVLLSYQVAYDGLTLKCAPSQSMVRPCDVVALHWPGNGEAFNGLGNGEAFQRMALATVCGITLRT